MKKSIFDKLESKIYWILETTSKYPEEITITTKDKEELLKLGYKQDMFMGVELKVE